MIDVNQSPPKTKENRPSVIWKYKGWYKNKLADILVLTEIFDHDGQKELTKNALHFEKGNYFA